MIRDDRSGAGSDAHVPIIDLDGPFQTIDLREGYDPQVILGMMPAVGGYEEERSQGMYAGPLYADGRTLHMGIDFWVPAGTPVLAVAPGRIYGLADNRGRRDYGPTIITEHVWDGRPIWMLYGHLSTGSLTHVRKEQAIEPGDVIGFVGKESENGGWVPHLHAQLSTRRPTKIDLPGVVRTEDRATARELYPDPRLILGRVY